MDSRIIADVVNKTGSFVGTENDVGGYPDYTPGQPPEDSDKDGIPNTWELSHDLNPNLISDGNGVAPSGYTWVEEYLNSFFTTEIQDVPSTMTPSIAPIQFLLLSN